MNSTQKNSLTNPTEKFWLQAASLVGVAIAYWAAVRLGLLFVAQPEGIAAVWPVSGLALSVLLLNPRAQWPKFLAVIFIMNAAGNWNGGNTLPVSLGFALANSLETFLAARFVTHVSNTKIAFETTREVLTLYGAALVINGFTALLGAAVPVIAFGAPFVDTWFLWWTSDGLGIILVTPFLISLFNSRFDFRARPLPLRHVLEWVFLFLLLGIFAWLLFGDFTDASKPLLRNYMVFPFLIWLAFRFRLPSMTSALILFASFAVGFTVQNSGIFAIPGQTLAQHLISVQIFLGVISLSGLLLCTLITERRQAAAVLQASELNFRNLAESTPDGILIVTAGGEHVYANRHASELMGLSPVEILQTTQKDLAEPAEYPMLKQRLADRIAGLPVPNSCESLFHRKDGTSFPAEVTDARTNWQGQSADLVFIHDITGRKEIEDARRLSEALLKTTQQLSKVGGWEWDIEKQQMFWTDETYHIHDFTDEDIIRGSPELINRSAACYDPEDRQKILSTFQRCITEGEPYDLELPFTTVTGRRMWIRTTAKAVWRQGHIVKVIGNIMDITDRKLAETTLRETNELFSLFLHHSPIYTFIKEVTPAVSKVLQASENYHQMIGIPGRDMIGKTMADLFPPEDAARFTADDWAVVSRGEVLKLDEELNGRYYTTIKFPLQQGERTLLAGYTIDITERVHAEENLRDSDLFVKGVLNSLTAHIAVLDENGVIVAVNEPWAKFARENGCPDPDAYLGFNYLTVCEAAYRNGDANASQADLGIRAVLNGTRSQFTTEYPCDSPTEQRWFTVTVAPQQQPRRGVIVIHQDITERKRAEQSLEASYVILKNALNLEKELARVDQLTDINNRRSLFEAAEHEFDIASRYHKPVAVMMYDIDNFKEINDTFGHTLGDRILQRVTEIARHQLRSADVIGRYGGDEFVILMPMTNAEHAYSLAERIRLEVAAGSQSTLNGEVRISISAGIIEMAQGETVENVFRRADQAMYTAKQAGRNRTVIG